MKYFLTILLLIPIACYSQSKQILFIVNDVTSVIHSKTSYKILGSNVVNQDSANQNIFDRISDFVFYDNDTSRYAFVKTTCSEISLSDEQVYPLNAEKSNQNRYTRPDIDAISQNISKQYDYTIVINKVNILSSVSGNKLELWYTMYDSELSEIISERYKAAYRISSEMLYSAFLQVLWEPCEAFEDRILVIIDEHIEGYNPYGSNVPERYTQKWNPGFLVTHEGDTLRGEVKYRDPYKVEYRLSPDSPAQLLSSGEIKCFESGNKKYKALFIHQISNSLGKYAFAQVVVEGKVILYKLGDHDSKKYYIHNIDQEKTIRVRFTPDKNRIINKNHLKEIFAHDPDSINEIETRNFGVKDLEKLVYKFNNRLTSALHSE